MQDVKPISDKMAVLQVIACLIKDPLLVSDLSFPLTVDDFPDQFHKIVYGAIEHLALGGAVKIDAIDIDQFLAHYPVQYKVFCDNNGIEYVQQAKNLAERNNFRYYYGQLRKYSLLNKLRNNGFDITPLYDSELVDPQSVSEMQEKFNDLKLSDIVDFYDMKLLELKQEFGTNTAIVENKIGDGILDMLDRFREKPDMGISLISQKMTTVFRGRRLGKLYLESAAQGRGKSRRAMGEAGHISIPWYWNDTLKKWVNTGMCEPTLVISTELELDECQTMLSAYVSGVPEDKIREVKCTPEEEERVKQANWYISQSQFYFVQISAFDIEDIETLIRKYHMMYNVNYVFYDYLSMSSKTIGGTSRGKGGKKLEDYQILDLFCRKLKELCNTLHIHIQTATQLNREGEQKDTPDATSIRGAFAIADQPDVATVFLPVRERDRDVISEYTAKGFEVAPNMVISVYKVRSGKYSAIKIYVRFDPGTCRLEDCFCTDYDGNFLNIENTNVIEVIDEHEADPEVIIADITDSIQDDENEAKYKNSKEVDIYDIEF